MGLIISIVHLLFDAKKKSIMKPMGFQLHLIIQMVIATRKQFLFYQIRSVCKLYFLIVQFCSPLTAMFMWKEKEKNLFQPHIRLRCCVLNASKQKQPRSSHTYQMNALFKRVIFAKEIASWLLIPRNFA